MNNRGPSCVERKQYDNFGAITKNVPWSHYDLPKVNTESTLRISIGYANCGRYVKLLRAELQPNNFHPIRLTEPGRLTLGFAPNF